MRGYQWKQYTVKGKIMNITPRPPSNEKQRIDNLMIYINQQIFLEDLGEKETIVYIHYKNCNMAIELLKVEPIWNTIRQLFINAGWENVTLMATGEIEDDFPIRKNHPDVEMLTKIWAFDITFHRKEN